MFTGSVAISFCFILLKVVAAWEDQGENRRIAAMDGDGAVPDKMVAGLVQEMTGEQMLPPPMGELVPRTGRTGLLSAVYFQQSV